MSRRQAIISTRSRRNDNTTDRTHTTSSLNRMPAAITGMESNKLSKHDAVCIRNRWVNVPFVMDSSYGTIGEHAQKFLKTMSKQADDKNMSWVTHALHSVSCAIQRGNAVVVERGVDASIRAQLTKDRPVHFSGVRHVHMDMRRVGNRKRAVPISAHDGCGYEQSAGSPSAEAEPIAGEEFMEEGW